MTGESYMEKNRNGKKVYKSKSLFNSYINYLLYNRIVYNVYNRYRRCKYRECLKGIC